MSILQTTMCVTADQIASCLRGELDGIDSRAILEHLQSCSACAETADSVEPESDSLIELLRDADVNPYAREPELAAALANASGLPPCTPPGRYSSGPSLDIPGYHGFVRVGRGGMSNVFRAHDSATGQVVAVKVIEPTLMWSREAIRRFQREARILQSIEHPNVVRYLKSGEHHGFHYLIMQWIDGVDVQSLLRERGPLPVSVACELIRQATVALYWIHNSQLVHRDVKPSNLLLGSCGTVCVSDFGLARDDSADASITTIHRTMGTPDFMSPEQSESAAVVGPASDIYSLGCSLFTLLTGRAPFHDLRTEYEKQRAHREQPVPTLATIRDDIPQRLSVLVERMVAKKSEHRPADARVVVETLSPFCSASDLADFLASENQSSRIEVATWSSVDSEQREFATQRQPANSGAVRSVVIAVAILTGVGMFAVHIGTWLAASRVEMQPDQRVVVHSLDNETPEIVRSGSIDAPRIVDSPFVAGDSTPSGTVSLAWTANGRQLAALNTAGAVQLYEADSDDSLSFLRTVPLESSSKTEGSISWSPDGRFLALLDKADGTVCLWDCELDCPGPDLDPSHVGIVASDWHPTENILLTGNSDGQLVVWMMQTDDGGSSSVVRAPPAIAGAHAVRFGGTAGVSWSPDGEMMFSRGNDRLLRIWSARTGRASQTRRLPVIPRSHAWYRSGAGLAVAMDDGTLRMFDESLQETRRTLMPESQDIRLMSLPNGRLVIVGRSVWLWDPARDEQPRPLFAERGASPLAGVRIDHGDRLVIGGPDCVLRTLRIEND